MEMRPALTVQDVAQALGAQQVLQTGHLILQVADQLIVGVLVDHRVALDVLGAVSVAVEESSHHHGETRRNQTD